jgi:hypothetical protein
MIITPLHDLKIPALMKSISSLPTRGRLAVSTNNLTYLDISDDFIHQVYPLLATDQIKMPNYFGEKAAGAHISVIYPEEHIAITKAQLNKEHGFHINGAFSAELGHKIYYVLRVTSPSLLQIRRFYGLSDLLVFKNQFIDFHITVGVSATN